MDTEKTDQMVKILLVDNGSRRPQATMELRSLASELSSKLGLKVDPVSLLHSSKIPAEDLGGEPAIIVKQYLTKHIQAGESKFLILPLFLGPSLALSDYLPKLVKEILETTGSADKVKVHLAEPLAGSNVERPDDRLSNILCEHVLSVIKEQNLSTPDITLVDHGSPARVVTQVRNAVAKQLAEKLGSNVRTVVASSMERRDGDEYDFNEPLLEKVAVKELVEGDVIVAMFFLLSGRHAGSGGDVVEICEELSQHGNINSIHITPLLAQHPLLVEILMDRANSIFNLEGLI